MVGYRLYARQTEGDFIRVSQCPNVEKNPLTGHTENTKFCRIRTQQCVSEVCFFGLLDYRLKKE